jgi:hypothetical protein
MLSVLLISGICLALGSWQLAVWLGEIRDKNRKYNNARDYADERKKPLLVVGGPWGGRRLRYRLKIPAHGSGDVCLDIDGNAITGQPNAVIASITHIPFADKIFGAVFASHVLEHLPTVDDAKRALVELDRVAETVFIAYPSKQSIAGWFVPGHHLWVWRKGKITYVKQRRGNHCGKEQYQLESIR